MKLFHSSQDRDDELLSAYLDNELAPAERARLERRLRTDSQLRLTLDGLRRVKTTLNTTAKVKPPRSFTLTPQMAGQPARPSSRLIPALNWATAIAAVLFAVFIASDLSQGLRLREAVPQPSVAQAPAEGFSAGAATAGQDLANAQKSMTATPATSEADALQLVAPAAESSAEPLTGAPSAGAGGGESPAPLAPQVSDGGLGGAADTTESTANVYGETEVTPTPESSLRALATEPPTQAPEPTATPAPIETPIPSPTFVAAAAAPAQYLAFNPIRLAQLALAVLLIGLITASILLRRK